MHKERIFSASSARHQGTSSGNMKPCPLCLCVVFSCPLLIFPSLPPFPVLRSQAPPRGGGRTERSLFLWNARARARRADARAARPVLGRAGPSRVADTVCLPAVLPGVSSFLFPSVLRPCPPRRRFRLSLPSAPARLRVAFLLRLAEPSVGSACRTPAVCCAEARPLPAPAFFSPVCP